MSHDLDHAFEAHEPISEPWYPSAALQKRLGAGTVAALLAGGLSGASAMLELLQPDRKGFTLATGLELAAILPQVWVLLAFLGLARELGSESLRRSSLGVFVTGWLLSVFVLADEDLVHPGVIVGIWVGVAAGLVWLLAVTLRSRSQSSGFPVWPVALGGFFLLKLGVRFLGRKNAFLPAEALVTVGLTGVLLLCVVGFTVWFGVALIRQRDRLGGTAALLGWLQILGTVAMIAVLGWMITAAVAQADQIAANPDAADEAMAEPGRILSAAALAAALVSALLTALLFTFVRARTDPDSPLPLEV